jgi:hypothetical protein
MFYIVNNPSSHALVYVVFVKILYNINSCYCINNCINILLLVVVTSYPLSALNIYE